MMMIILITIKYNMYILRGQWIQICYVLNRKVFKCFLKLVLVTV